MIRLILVVVIGVLALSYLGISLRDIVDSPTGQQNIAFVWQLIQEAWNWLASVVHGFSLQSLKTVAPVANFSTKQ